MSQRITEAHAVLLLPREAADVFFFFPQPGGRTALWTRWDLEPRTSRSARFAKQRSDEARSVTGAASANQLNLRLLSSDTPLTWNLKREPTRPIISAGDLLPFASHLVSRFLESLIVALQICKFPKLLRCFIKISFFFSLCFLQIEICRSFVSRLFPHFFNFKISRRKVPTVVERCVLQGS